ncbi:ABC transporter ATP-binding protein [Desulfonatronum parangueonense]
MRVKQNEGLFKRFLPYFSLLGAVRKQFAAAIFFGVIFGVASGFGLPFMADRVFPIIFGPEPPPLSVLIAVTAFIPAIFLVRSVSGFLNVYLIHYCGGKVLEALRVRVFTKLQTLPLAFYQKNKSGDLLARVINDTGHLQGVVTNVANDLIKQPLTFLGAVGAVIYLSLKQQELLFVLLTLLLVPVCILPIRIIGKKLLHRAHRFLAQTADLTTILNENLTSTKEIRAFSLENREIRKFEHAVRELFGRAMKVVKYSHILSPTIEVVAAFGVAGAVFYASSRGVGLEQILPLIFALYMSYEPVKKLGRIHNEIRKGEASLERLEYILSTEDSVPDPEVPESLPLEKVRGEIHFERVFFAYDQGIPVLQDINATIAPGEVVALVGPSGAGKTTFANLIPRFYDVSAGSIRIDGHDLRNLRKEDLRRTMAIVPQDPVLFNDTVRYNIMAGDLEASPEAVEHAAERAFAHEFIRDLPHGYETIVGEKGMRLSGGQKQRLALARAFLRNAPILILDEATSALDATSEEMIQQALSGLIRNKTVLIIAHRFSTIRLASNIFLFESGQITHKGDHEKLYLTSAVYKRLYDQQYMG